MDIRSFWNRVKAGIKDKAVTQKEAARSCRIPYQKLRNWMSKCMIPPLNYAHRLSQYLDVSLEYLISGEGTDKISKTNEEILVLLKQLNVKFTEIRRNNIQ